MKTLVYLLALTVVPALAGAEEVWRWRDANGTIHYTNQADAAPTGAAVVETRIVVEAQRLPAAEPDLMLRDGVVIDARDQQVEPPSRPRAPRRIYSEQRLRFGCYAGDLLFAGGWAHPDDIAVQGNCLPYLLGPEAWLNAARSELALRANGIDWRQVVRMYLADQAPPRASAGRVSQASTDD